MMVRFWKLATIYYVAICSILKNKVCVDLFYLLINGNKEENIKKEINELSIINKTKKARCLKKIHLGNKYSIY